MTPDDNSLETGYEASSYNSSLEGQHQTGIKLPSQSTRLNVSLFRFNKVAVLLSVFAVVLFLVVAGIALGYDKLHQSNKNTVNSEEASGNYKVGSNIPVQNASETQLLQLGQVNQLEVNGQLTVTKSLVLTPTSTAPSTPTPGEIYFDKSSNQPYYYNGSSFVSLVPTASPQQVTSLGGSSGALNLGGGLSVSGNTLSISSTLLQSLSSTSLNTPVVNSLQGLTGAVSFTGGPGISISGTSISNTGVINLTSSNSSVNIANQGNGSYDLTLSSGGGVNIGPNTAQTDTSNNPSIYLNKTGTGDLLDLQTSGVDEFVVSDTGQITTGTIDYSQVQGAPSSTVTDIDGVSGSVGLGTGLSITGNILSNNGVTSFGGSNGAIGLGTGLGLSGGNLSNTGVTTFGGANGAITLGTGLGLSGNSLSNTGVVSITGTANQVIASASSGALTLSLPQSIATSSSPTFAGETLNSGGLTVSGASSLNGGTSTDSLTVTAGSDLEGATTVNSTLNVQGGLTVGVPGSQLGTIYLSNTGSARTVDLVGLNPSGTGNGTIQFPTIAGGSTDTVCLANLANCGSSSSTVTTSSAGTPGTIALFTGAEQLANSSITDNGTTVTIGELLTASTITAGTIESSSALNITPGGTLTIGATNHTLILQGNSSSTFAASANGFTDTLGFTAPTTASHTITLPDASGTVCLEGSGSCGFAGGGSGVTSVDTLAGDLSINNTTGTGTTITINDASTSQKGIAEFNSSDFQGSGGVIDTIQGITTTSDVQFDSLALDYGGTCTAGGNLCLNSTGTVYAANYLNDSSTNNLVISGGSNNIMLSNDGGANTFLLPTTGGTGQTFCTTGITCASGGGQAVILEPGTGSTSTVQSASSNRNALFIDKVSGSGNLVQLQTGSSQDALVIDGSGNATFSNTTTAATLDVTGTLQANTITPNSSLTVGSTSQTFTVQGNQSSDLLAQGSGNSTYVGFGTPIGNTISSGSIYYDFDNSAATNTLSTPYFICTTAGNCSGTGGSVTALGGSSANVIPLFTTTSGAGGNIATSILSETGSNTINDAGNLVVGAAGHGQLSVGVASTVNGTIVVNNASNANSITIQEAAVPSGSVTLSLPTSSGTFAVSATGPLQLNSTTGALSCPSCDTSAGGGGVAAVQSLNTLTGDIILNNSSTSGQHIIINDAKADGSTLGIATFNATNFTDNGSGVINTAQNISTSSSPTFANLIVQGTTGLTLGSTSNDGAETFLDGTGDGFTTKLSQTTLTGNQIISIPNNSGTLAVAASGNLSLSALGNLTITNSPTFTTSVTTPLLQSSGTLNITPGGALTVGSTAQSFTLQGTSASSISATSGSFATTVNFNTPTANNAIFVPNQGGTICLSSNNCNFAASGSYLLNQTTQQTSANLNIQSVAGAVAAKIQGASGQNILNLYSSASSSTALDYFDGSGDLNVSGALESGTSSTAGSLILQDGSGNLITFNSVTQANSVVISVPADTNTSDVLCLSTLGNCTGTHAGSGDTSYIFNQTTQQASANIDIQSTSGAVAAKIQGTSGQNILNLYSSASSSTPVVSVNGTGAVTIENSTNSTAALQIQNSSAANLLTADTTNMRLGVDVTYALMSSPTISGTATATTGGTLAQNTTYYYEITAVDANGGETTPSTQASQLTGNTTATNTITLTWAPIAGAAGYHIYRSTTSGVFTNVGYYSTPGTVSGSNLTFTDTNATKNTTTGGPPTTTTAYVATNVANTNNLELSIGGNGTPMGQLYVSGTVPSVALSTISTGASATGPYSVYVQGSYAYVVNQVSNNLVIYNISNPAAPALVGSVSTGSSSNPYNVYVSGNYAYVANWGSDSLAIINISNPANPTLISSTTTGINSPESVYVQGNYAYVANEGSNNLAIYNISNPANPTNIGSVATGSGPDSVYVQGNYAYVANGGSNSLGIFNVSNPASPTSVGSVATGSGPYAVYVQGNYAYVANYTTGNLQIINVSNPASPTSVGSVATGSDPNAVYVQGNYAYVTSSGAGNLQIINVSNPASPVSIGSVNTASGSASSVYVQGRYAYVTSYGFVGLAGILQVFDLGGEYTQQLQAGGIQAGTLNVVSDSTFGGDISVAGGLSVGGNTELQNNLGVAGAANIQGSTLMSGGSNQLLPPVGLTTTPTGTTGSSTYDYSVTAVNAYGGQSTATATGTSKGNATLSGSNYNHIAWSAVTGATGYDVYATYPTTGLIGYTTSNSFNDTGISAAPLNSSSAPTINTTAQLTVEGGALFENTTNSIDAFQIDNASGNFMLNADSNNNKIEIGQIGTPALLLATPGGGGSLPASTTYYFKITALDAEGDQSTPTLENYGTTSGTCVASGNCEIGLIWSNVGAASYRVYFATTSGSEANYFTTTANSYIFSTTAGSASGSPPAAGNAYVNQLTTAASGTNVLTNTTILPTFNSTTTFQIQNTSGTSILTGDTTNNRIDIGTLGTASGQLYVSGSIPTSAAGSVSTGTNPQSVYVLGSYAYVVNNGSNTLTIYNISNPASPASVGSVATGSNPTSVYVQGNYAYVTSGTTLNIYNISNPASPSSVGSVATGIGPVFVFVQGNYAYVVNYTSSTLQIFNVANPASPSSVGSVATGSNPRSVYVQGRYAYVANYGSGTLTIYNVANPASPSSVGSVATGTNPYSVYVQGNYAYVANATAATLTIYNISNPASPASVGSVSTGGSSSPESVYVQGEYAYVVEQGSNALGVFNVATPASPSSVGSVTTGTGPTSVYVQGNYAYVANYGSGTLTTYNVGGTYSQSLQAGGIQTSTLNVVSDSTFGGDISLQGGLSVGTNAEIDSNLGVGGAVLFEDQTNSSTAFQVQNTSGTNLLQVDTSGNNINVGSTGSTSLASTVNIASSTNSAQVVNIGSVSNISDTTSILGLTENLTSGGGGINLSTGSTTGNIDLTTNSASSSIIAKSSTNSTTAFQIQNTSSVSILTGDTTNNRIDIGTIGTASGQLYVSGSLPTAATGSVSTGSGPHSVYVSGSYAYVVNYTSGTLTIYNVSNPSSPVSVGSVSTGTNPIYVYVQGNYAYVTNYGSNTLGIYNVSNRAVPTSVGSVSTGSAPYSVYVQGNYAYVTNYTSNTLQVFNISNPASPTSVGSVSTGTNPNSVYVQGNYAYVTNYTSNTLQVFNISNPASPTSVGSVAAVSVPYSVYVQGNYAYVANYGSSNLTIYNVANPASPASVGSVATGANPTSVYVQGNYAYVAASNGADMQMFNVSNPASPSSVGYVNTGTSPISVYVQGNYAYVVNYTSSNLQIFNIGGTYSQSLQAGGIQTNTLNVVSDSNFEGDVGIQGGLTVGTNAEIGGNLGVSSIQATSNVTAGSVLTSSIDTPTAGGILTIGEGNASSIDIFGGAGGNINLFAGSSGTIQLGPFILFGSPTITQSINIGDAADANYTSNIQIGSSTGSSTIQLLAANGITANAIITQTVSSSTTGTISLLGQSATNTNTTAGSTTVNAHSITLSGTNNSNVGANVLNGINFNNVTAATNNTFNGLNFGTGYTNYVNAPNFQVTGSGAITLGTIGTTGGQLTIDSGHSAGSFNIQASSSQAIATTLTIPTDTNSTDTICLETLGNCGGGGGSGILNQTSQQTSANIDIQSTSGAVAAKIQGASGNDILDLYSSTSSSTPVASFGSAGAVTLENQSNSTTAFQIQNSSGVSILTGDTTNSRIDIGTIGTPSGQLYVSGSVPSAATGLVSTGSSPSSVFVQGDYAYVVNTSDDTLTLYDISNPASPTNVSSIATDSGPISVYVQGNYAYVANTNSSTLGIYNVSNPAVPVSVGSVATGINPFSVYVQGNYAYVVNSGDNTLGVYNVSNPAAPVSVGSVATGSAPFSVRVQGNYAYVVNSGDNTLGVYDISNPASPASVGSVATDPGPASVYVQGNYAYVTSTSADTLTVYNISNPTSPTSVGSVATGSVPYSVYVQGNYAYVANGISSTLGIYNVSNPASPTSVGSVATGAGPVFVFVQGNYAYVVNASDSTLGIYNIGGTYSQSLQAGGIQTDTLNVVSNSSFGGDISIAGGLNVSTNAEIDNNLGIGGSALFQNQTDSTSALVVQNASGSNDIFVVDTADSAVCIDTSSCTGSGEALGVEGDIVASGAITASSSPDYAEDITSEDPTITAAELVSADPNKPGSVVKSSTPYDPDLLGAISTSPSYIANGGGLNGPGADQVPLTLVGRIPVKVNTENGNIAVGDYITSSSIPGVGMKSTQAGTVIGRALESYSGSGTGTILVFIQTEYYNPTSGSNMQGGGNSFSNIQVSGQATVGSLVVANSASIGGNLTVAGNLSLAGNADVTGNLTVAGTVSVGNITINGHIITGGTVQPTVAAGTAVCSNSTVTITGNDTTGTVTVNTSSKCTSAGSLATVSFGTAYGASPHVTLTPTTAAAAMMPYFNGQSTDSDFTIDVTKAPAGNSTYSYTYQVEQ